MTKRSRTILFLACLFLFILITPTVIFYAQGYRVDFDRKKISQTGGIYIKTLPKQVEIYMDGELKKKTDFFFGSALIENVLPKEYKVQIKKEKYYSWEKTLSVVEKKVTEAKNIILFSQVLESKILTKRVESFWFSPDQKKIVLKENEPNGWALKLFEIDKEIKSYLVNENDLSLQGATFFNLKFSDDSKEVYFEVEINEQVKTYSLKLDEASPVPKIKEPSLIPESVIAYQENNNEIYYLDNKGFVFKANNDFEDKTKIAGTAFSIKIETEYSLNVFQNNIFIQEGSKLYKYNSDSEEFDILFENIKGIKISPNHNKLVYFSNKELWILYLKQDERNEAGDKVLLFRLSENINNVSWLNPYYLIYNVGDIIKISEIDTRGNINVADVAEIKNPQIFWSGVNKKLYILSNNNLYFLGGLFP